MNPKTIYFLQSLWDVDVKKDELLKIAKNGMRYDFERELKGVLDERTLWISDEAKKLRRHMYAIRSRIDEIKKPYDLLNINDDLISTSGRIKALQIKSAQTLNARSGILIKDLHILVRQLFPFTLLQLEKQCTYQIYRLLVLTGSLDPDELGFPESGSLSDWIDYYQNKLMPHINGLSMEELDCRWAYERKQVWLNKEIQTEQFVSVLPTEEELKQPLGIPGIGTGKNGEFRIFGRGRITNLSPSDFGSGVRIRYRRAVPDVKNYSTIPSEVNNPRVVLDKIFEPGERYLIEPRRYFEFVNNTILASIFNIRIKSGNCIYCGAPLYVNKCSKCGRKWDL